jgi:MFS family permease
VSLRQILGRRAFWVLLVGGSCSAGAVGAVSQHLKLLLKDGGFAEQSLLNHAFSQTLLVLLVVSAAGRLLVGRLADRLAKRHVLTLTFALFAASLPPLLWLRPPQTPYLFAVLFGLAMGGDFLLVALMAGDHFGATSLTRVLAIILPVMTVGQTWFPYFVALLREWSGSYAAPLAVVFLAAAAGRAVMALLPELPNKPGDGERAAATF